MNKPVQVILWIYMLLIMAVMPFYFTAGYTRIGTNKYEFFYAATTRVGIVFLPFLGIYLLLRAAAAILERREAAGCRVGSLPDIGEEIAANGGRERCSSRKKIRLSVTDWFVLVYGISLILSGLFSEYQEMTSYGNAWEGTSGWYLGLRTQLLFLGVYIAVSRFWKPRKWMLFVWLPVTFAVYLLGYLNRFSVYPLVMEGAKPAYISTIGNINWYCGYVVTVFFGVLYYWWAGAERQRWLSRLLVPYLLLGFGTLVTQGSSSGLMTLAVILFVMYLLSAADGGRMERLWLAVILLGLACSVSMGIRYFYPESVQQADALTDLLTTTKIPLIILAVGLFVYGVVYELRSRGRYPAGFFKAVGRIAGVLLLLLGVLLVAGIVANTLYPGCLGSLSELGIFTFDAYWGSRRGATFQAGFQSWLDQDVTGKLFGVGPDCMAAYIHLGENQEIRDMIAALWGSRAKLTNAHNEWLTVLVNEGVLGVIGYVGMILSAVIRFLKQGRKYPVIGACGMGILAYTINNMVSFQQAMSTATMFLILGIGEAFMRRLDPPVDLSAGLLVDPPEDSFVGKPADSSVEAE